MNIRQKLEHLLKQLVSKGSLAEDYLRPGLSRSEIDELTKDLPHPLPEELFELYQWRDGCEGEWELLLFRDQAFLPLSEALVVRQQLTDSPYATEEYLSEFKITQCFPFADFQGETYLLPLGSTDFNSQSTRPIFSAGEGVEIIYDSFEAMLDTLIEWSATGEVKETSVSISPEAELEIWKKHNPKMFENR